MLRDSNLIPLSRQHQHALALCVRLNRAVQAGQVDLEAWQIEIQQLFETEIGTHFEAEEKEMFPAAARFPEMQALVTELLAEHVLLRHCFSQAAARSLDEENLRTLGEKLANHIRKEERQLFERLQMKMTPEELAALGEHLETALKDAAQSCILTTEATKLKPKR